MTDKSNGSNKGYVEHIRLADELEKRVALATVRVGEVLIHGVTVWQSGRAKIRVYFPSYKAGYRWDEAIELSQELRSEVEADVISAYKAEKHKQKQAEKQRQGGKSGNGKSI
jgi:hypothetical protein